MGTQITTKEHHQHSSNRAHTRASLHFIRPLNATFALVCELCQLVAISSSLRGTRPEESSQISRLVALEQSLATWLRRVLAAAAGITRAAYFFKSCNRRTENSYYRGTVKPGWNQVETTFEFHTLKATIWKSGCLSPTTGVFGANKCGVWS